MTAANPATPAPRVLVAGLPRSGTTWVGEVLGRTAGARYLHEPDNHLVRPDDTPGGTTMGLDDKFDNKTDELKGKAKEATGKATDDEKLEAEGRGDQAGANVKQAGEKIKDAFKS